MIPPNGKPDIIMTPVRTQEFVFLSRSSTLLSRLFSGVGCFKIPNPHYRRQKIQPRKCPQDMGWKVTPNSPNRKGIFVFQFHNFSGSICSTSGRIPSPAGIPLSRWFSQISHLKWEILEVILAPEGRVPSSPTNPQVSSAPGLMQLSFSLNAWELVTTTWSSSASRIVAVVRSLACEGMFPILENLPNPIRSNLQGGGS